MKRILLALSVAVLAACGDSTGPISPTAIIGTWNLSATVPGTTEQWTLALNGTSVSGYGNFADEAGPSGTLVVTGTQSADSLHLSLTYTYAAPVAGLLARHATFEGHMLTASSLCGKLTFDGQAAQTAKWAKAGSGGYGDGY